CTDPSDPLGIACEFARCRAVRFDARNHDIEDRMTALALQDVHRKLHAAKIFIVRKNTFEERVPGQTGIDLGLDVLDEILLVDRTRNRVFTKRRERYEFGLTACSRYLCAICCCTFEESVRRQPDVEGSGLSESVRVLVLFDVAGFHTDAFMACGRIVAS